MRVRGYVAPTDWAWFDYLSRLRPSEVNFWRPSQVPFRALQPGEPLFFKLKSPRNAIGGLGWFTGAEPLPVWLAWESFEDANGVPDEFALMRSLDSLNRAGGSAATRVITCISLADPVFLPADAWVDPPADWHRSIVAGKSYDLESGEGARILRETMSRAGVTPPDELVPGDTGPRFGKPGLRPQRLGQGTFSRTVISAYGFACAVTGESAVPVLQASHIKPYSRGGEHRVSNGLALRSDIHRLFDLGYLTVTTDYRLRVSDRLAVDFARSAAYVQWDGRALALPADPGDWPARDMLTWHNKHVFGS